MRKGFSCWGSLDSWQKAKSLLTTVYSHLLILSCYNSLSVYFAGCLNLLPNADLAAEMVANRLLSAGYDLRTFAGFVQPLVRQPNTPADTRPENIESYLDKRVSTLGFVGELFVADPAGNFFYPSMAGKVTRAPDWPFIAKYLSDNPNREVVTPLYTDPETGELGIWMLSKLHSDTGDVAAVIVARQSPDVLSGSLAGLSLSAGQSIAILDESMMLVARLPVVAGAAVSPGQILTDSLARRFIDSGSDSYQVIIEGPIPNDGEARFYAFKRVPGAPYIVVVGEKTSVALQDWYQSLWVGATGIISGPGFGKAAHGRVKYGISEKMERRMRNG